MIDLIVVDEMTVKADKSYLRFDSDEWYRYERGNITYVEDSAWLEALYLEQDS